MITLATLPTASLQDMFTQARDHLLQIGLFPDLDSRRINLLAHCQKIHDLYETNEWEEQLLKLAIAYDLEWV